MRPAVGCSARYRGLDPLEGADHLGAVEPGNELDGHVHEDLVRPELHREGALGGPHRWIGGGDPADALDDVGACALADDEVAALHAEDHRRRHQDGPDDHGRGSVEPGRPPHVGADDADGGDGDPGEGGEVLDDDGVDRGSLLRRMAAPEVPCPAGIRSERTEAEEERAGLEGERDPEHHQLRHEAGSPRMRCRRWTTPSYIAMPPPPAKMMMATTNPQK